MFLFLRSSRGQRCLSRPGSWADAEDFEPRSAPLSTAPLEPLVRTPDVAGEPLALRRRCGEKLWRGRTGSRLSLSRIDTPVPRCSEITPSPSRPKPPDPARRPSSPLAELLATFSHPKLFHPLPMELRHQLRQDAADSPAGFTKVCAAGGLQAYVQLVATCAYRCDKLCAHAFVGACRSGPRSLRARNGRWSDRLELGHVTPSLPCSTDNANGQRVHRKDEAVLCPECSFLSFYSRETEPPHQVHLPTQLTDQLRVTSPRCYIGVRVLSPAAYRKN